MRALKESTKKSDEVWVRWFFISNWGSLVAVPRDGVDNYIKEMCTVIYDGPEFKQKAKFEIIDGNYHRVIEAKDVA